MGMAREDILGAIRRSLKSRANDRDRQAAVEQRIGKRARGPAPTHARVAASAIVDQFTAKAEAVTATVTRVSDLHDVPGAIAAYLSQHNLAAEIARAPDPLLDSVPWDEAPLLTVRRDPPGPADPVGVTAAFGGVAETGSLVMYSAPNAPAAASLLPDTSIAVLMANRIGASLNDVWDRTRAIDEGLPRALTLVTGPSCTGDLELTIERGAHGPRRVHVVVVDADG